MRTAQGAIDWMRHQHRTGATGWRGWCLRASRTAWGLPGGWNSANDWWAAVPAAHRHPWSSAPPLGAPVFFAGGNWGHIGLSDGRGGLWHTDGPTADRIGHTSINWPRDRWGFRNVGWASWLNGAVLPVGSVTAPPSGGGNPPTQEDSMDYIQATRGVINLAPNTWRTVPLQENQHNYGNRHTAGSANIRIGNCRYDAVVRLQLARLNPAATISARMVAVNSNGVVQSSSGTHSRICDVTNMEFSFAGSVPRDQQLRLELTTSQQTEVPFSRVSLMAYPR